MADPTTTEAANGSAASGSTGQGTGGDLVQAIAQAVAAAVTTSVNELTNKLNTLQQSIESRVKQTGTNEDNNFESSVVGIDDPYENKRRDRLAYDGMQAMLAGMATMTLENANLILKQQLRHADIAHSRYWGDAPSGAAAGKSA